MIREQIIEILSKRFNAGFSYDILKKDTEIMFGWSF